MKRISFHDHGSHEVDQQNSYVATVRLQRGTHNSYSMSTLLMGHETNTTSITVKEDLVLDFIVRDVLRREHFWLLGGWGTHIASSAL